MIRLMKILVLRQCHHTVVRLDQNLKYQVVILLALKETSMYGLKIVKGSKVSFMVNEDQLIN